MAQSTTVVEYKTVPIGGAKNGGSRKIAVRKTVPKTVKKSTPAKIRPSLVPGTIVILLAGQFRGSRVVLLKALDSGLLLVTGPYKVNGVSLRRVSSRYVIATSVKINLDGVKTDKLNESLFGKTKDEELSPEFAALQKELDVALLPKIKAVPQLKAYMQTSFSLKKGQAPHAMKF